MANFACFDLEGPLSPRDNAYDLMQLFPHGGRIFEVLSRYDDLLALEGRPDYEPGDTLSLIVPFLALHNIREADIARLAGEAELTGGADKLISELEYSGWKVFCISTSYEQFALHITQRLGIYSHNVACTRFPLDELNRTLGEDDRYLLQQAENDIIQMYPPDDDARLKPYLDSFFWSRLPATAVGGAMRQVQPVGGQRKVNALSRFAAKHGEPLSRWVAIGDSITDCKMLQEVDAAGGLAIAFNANEYALPYASMGLASTAISDLNDIFAAWHKGQRKEAGKLVRQKEKAGASGDRGHFHWLVGRENLDDIIATHKRIRGVVRAEAGKLG